MDDKKLIGIDALVRNVGQDLPDVHIEILPNHDDMLFLYRVGAANWELWAGSNAFHHLIYTHGSEADKRRLEALNVGYIR